ncbi:Uncharacterised protein family (UPF0167) [Anaerosporobacter mobilis DSM 15930]|uniref:Uncharacterized protein family (UPF0167) n=1 Tax=Anaerosporobacter mobilis DSM 15930 TaxID=1120996 RepID=A0A1M7NGC0_9FIRM|nr:CbrC family protein [Anaerosporobacter mobilis]SHN02803.1 Uncharacterised protein family (UPF0167) [Anaerosporobacter mobilis DSM 15930]
MKNYKYFCNVKENADFTKKNCQFCGSNNNCLEGVYFEQDNVESICLECFDLKKAVVDIPEYIIKRVGFDYAKVEELASNPPIPWVQSNDWQVCCNDYMQYIGEWGQENFRENSNNENAIAFFEKNLDEDTLNKVDDINVLWEDLGYNTVAYVFKCNVCGKMKVVCQSY